MCMKKMAFLSLVFLVCLINLTTAREAKQTRNQHTSWKRGDQLTGRTRGDEIVVFTSDESLIGQLVLLKITSATALTLHGEVTSTSGHGFRREKVSG